MLARKENHFYYDIQPDKDEVGTSCERNLKDIPKPLPFDTEAELVKYIELEFFGQWKRSNASYIRELDCTNGVADIVVFQLKKNHKMYLNIGKIPPRWVYALHHLPYRKIFTTDDLANRLGVSKERATKAIRKYLSLGFCVAGSKPHTWKKLKQPQLLTSKIYAIEAKLSKWSQALSQAIRYLDYANQSWVILDSSCANSAIKNIEQFQKYNIGLATIDTSGKFRVQYNPFSKKEKSEYKLWYANAEIARIMSLSDELESNN